MALVGEDPERESPPAASRVGLRSPVEDALAVARSTGCSASSGPLFFATVAFFMFQAGREERAASTPRSARAVMGIWSSTSTSAGIAMQRERWHGTLELLVAAPAQFSLVMLPMTIAMSSLGIYSMAATLFWGRVAVRHPRARRALGSSASRSPVTVVSIGLVGFLMAVAFVRYRASWALGNLFEYPVWLICGFLVTPRLLPGLGREDRLGAAAVLGHATRSARRRGRRDAAPRRRVCAGARPRLPRRSGSSSRTTCSPPPAERATLALT